MLRGSPSLTTCKMTDCTFSTKSAVEVNWSPDGAHLAIASTDKMVRIAQLTSGDLKVIQNIAAKEMTTTICWCPTEFNKFCIAGEDKLIEIWDVRASRATAKIPSLGHNIYCSWSPDGKYVATGNNSDTLAVFDVAAAKLVKKMPFKNEVNEFAWGIDSRHLLIAASASGTGKLDMGSIEIISLENDDLTQTIAIPAHTTTCSCLKIDSKFRKLAVGANDYIVSIWDLEELICQGTISTLEYAIRSLSFNGDGSMIAVSGFDSGLVSLCDVGSCQVIQSVDTRAIVEKLSWNPKYNLLAIGLNGDKKLSAFGDDHTDLSQQSILSSSASRGGGVSKQSTLKLLTMESA